MTALLVTLTLAALILLSLNHTQRKVTVVGVLVPDGGAIEVVAPLAGTIATIHVRQHQRVVAGAPLFTLDMGHTLVVDAPLNGRVQLLLQAGMRVVGSQQVLALLPDAAQLQARLQVPGNAIRLVAEGQTVPLRFDAFPYRKFGVQRGTVRSIAASSDVISTGAGSPQPLYTLIATLDKQTVTAYGLEAPLRSGMSLNTDIVVDECSLL